MGKTSFNLQSTCLLVIDFHFLCNAVLQVGNENENWVLKILMWAIANVHACCRFPTSDLRYVLIKTQSVHFNQSLNLQSTSHSSFHDCIYL